MNRNIFFLSSSLEKVFPDKEPDKLLVNSTLSGWPGTKVSIQLVYFTEDVSGFMPHQEFEIEIKGSPCDFSLRNVQLIPSEMPVYGERDEFYLTDKPGLYPDLLNPIDDNKVLPIPGQYKSLWISWDLPENIKPSDYKININAKAVEKKILPNGVLFQDENVKNLIITNSFTLKVSKAKLPEQKLIHTEWLHTDCLGNYYGTEIFDNKHWKIIENFIENAHKHYVNMILTPIFTPPLDTPKGGQRRTVQLVNIDFSNGNYNFDFTNLRKWTKICKKHGIKYIEIPHFCTQWGAECAPKIMATVKGKLTQIFGWNTKATSPEYNEFLQSFLPKLQDVLNEEGYDSQHIFYHISDEPSLAQLDSYKAARNMVKNLIPENHIIDALSNVEFYKEGLVPKPIPGTTEIEDFYKEHIKGLWVYYCCAQCKLVPNRFFAMDSGRNRIMGVLMYLYKIEGFLHWGFNFYNSKFSLKPLNPFINTHGDFGYPSGDPFLVYPGDNGTVLDSIRAEVQDEGILDLRALDFLESITSRKFVENLIYETSDINPITFTNYPRSRKWILDLRERVAQEIENKLI